MNPAVFWFGVFCVPAALIIGLFKRDKRVLVLITAFAAQYLPWFLVTRCLFIYHYFTAVPFLILLIAYILEFIHDYLPGIIGKVFKSRQAEVNTYRAARVGIYSYLVLAVILFILAYPALSGLIVDSGYMKLVKWMNII